MDLAQQGHIANVQVRTGILSPNSCSPFHITVCRGVVPYDSRVLSRVPAREVGQTATPICHEPGQVPSVPVPYQISRGSWRQGDCL